MNCSHAIDWLGKRDDAVRRWDTPKSSRALSGMLPTGLAIIVNGTSFRCQASVPLEEICVAAAACSAMCSQRE